MSFSEHPIQLMSIHVLTRIGQDHRVTNRHLGQGYIVKHRRTRVTKAAYSE